METARPIALAIGRAFVLCPDGVGDFGLSTQVGSAGLRGSGVRAGPPGPTSVLSACRPPTAGALNPVQSTSMSRSCAVSQKLSETGREPAIPASAGTPPGR